MRARGVIRRNNSTIAGRSVASWLSASTSCEIFGAALPISSLKALRAYSGYIEYVGTTLIMACQVRKSLENMGHIVGTIRGPNPLKGPALPRIPGEVFSQGSSELRELAGRDNSFSLPRPGPTAQ